MALNQLPGFIRALLDPAVYPHAAPGVELLQTHISYVLLAGDFVYKIKKPVDFGFLDFTTLEQRKYFCNRELLLNRRLCPTLYLEVVPIASRGQGFALGGDGTVVEYAVKMARLPEAAMMDKVISRGELRQEHLDRIIDVLKPFYERAQTGSGIEPFGTAEAVGRNVLDNLDQIGRFAGGPALGAEEHQALIAYTREFLRQEALFDQRIQAGRIRDCHGDLYSANICLADRVYIFDCIEFNDRFRYADVASDIAFLAMDLDFYGLETLSDYFVSHFAADTGDAGLRRMLRFYKCYRAAVRGKIGLLTGEEPEVNEPGRQEALERARRYFALALKYVRGG